MLTPEERRSVCNDFGQDSQFPRQFTIGNESFATESKTGPTLPFFRSTKFNKCKQLFGVVLGTDGGSKSVYVLPFSWGKKETHMQYSQAISAKRWNSPGQWENPETIP